jgi:hypothetical protein
MYRSARPLDIHQRRAAGADAKWPLALPRVAMTACPNLIAEWERFEEAAFEAESSIEHTLDEYCAGGAPAPTPAQIASARRLRFVARHRLRWILYQTRSPQAKLALV